MIAIIDCGSIWIENIKLSVQKSGYDSGVIQMNDIKKTNLEKFSGIIISGRPTLLTQENISEFLDLFDFIKTTKIPVLGICFGHQIIGLVYGATIQVGSSIDKMENIQIIGEDKLFNSIENTSFFQESHAEFITLPKDFILLAKSESCENEAMKHKDKSIYSTQFHPEVSGEEGQKLLDNFLSLE